MPTKNFQIVRVKEWSHHFHQNYKASFFKLCLSLNNMYPSTYHFFVSTVSLALLQGLCFLKWKPCSLPTRGLRTQEKTDHWTTHTVSPLLGYAVRLGRKGSRGGITFILSKFSTTSQLWSTNCCLSWALSIDDSFLETPWSTCYGQN